MYENRIMKPTKNCFKRESKRVKEGMKLIKVYRMHVWKYHNEIPLYDSCVLIKKRKIKCDLTWRMFHRHVKGVCLHLLLSGELYKCQISLTVYSVIIQAGYSLIFCLAILSLLVSGVLKSLTTNAWPPVSDLSICAFQWGCSDVGHVYIITVIILLN
jgi:hypothetical protein